MRRKRDDGGWGGDDGEEEKEKEQNDQEEEEGAEDDDEHFTRDVPVDKNFQCLATLSRAFPARGQQPTSPLGPLTEKLQVSQGLETTMAHHVFG